jgi:hypothetical protein
MPSVALVAVRAGEGFPDFAAENNDLFDMVPTR